MRKVLLGFAMLVSVSLSAQVELGFKVGLSYTTIDGPSELGPDGEELEEFDLSSGFIMGLVLDFPITDIVGIRGEILYSQRNFSRQFEGEGYLILPPTDQVQVAIGNKRTNLEVINTYIDIPVMGYYQFGRFEISGGLNFGLLVGSRGEGSRTFLGELESGADVNLLEGQILDYNYLTDIPRGFSGGDAILVDIGETEPLPVPRRPGAYFDYPSRGRGISFAYYNRFEVGAIGGLSFELNRGLYLGVRVHYGLSDITDNSVDASEVEFNEVQPVYRNDRDRNLGFNGTIMFMF